MPKAVASTIPASYIPTKPIARDVDLLKPIFERMREQGFDLLEKNAVLANELRRTLPEIDRVEKELGKAAKAIQSVSALVTRYRERLRDLCDTAASANLAVQPEQNGVIRQTLGAYIFRSVQRQRLREHSDRI